MNAINFIKQHGVDKAREVENVVLQAKVDELQVENKILNQAASTHLKNQMHFKKLYDALVEQLYPYAIDLEEPVDGDVNITSQEFINGYNRARECAHYNLLEMMESDVEYIRAQCDMLGGGVVQMKAIKIPCEHDLLSKNHDVWVNAVMRCKHGFGYCGSDGYCHVGGSCFADQELTREQAILEVDRLAQELHNAKIENDKLRNAASQLVNQLEFTKDQNLKSGNGQRVFALRFCIHEIKKAME